MQSNGSVELKEHLLARAAAALPNRLLSGESKRRIFKRLEGGEYRSATLRRWLLQVYDVEVGEYSYGSVLEPGRFKPGTRVGRYVSAGPGISHFAANHPYESASMHPFWYAPALGVSPKHDVARTRLAVGHDAWLGGDSVITAGCIEVGIGAVVGAGSVVTRSVPAFAIVVGNPARLLRYRFDDNIQEQLLASRWWEHPANELRHLQPLLRQPLDSQGAQHLREVLAEMNETPR